VLQQKQGTATLTDVLLADNALREAQQNYLSAVVDYLKADLEIKKLTGAIKN
jgi:OMF family outer membrane factor